MSSGFDRAQDEYDRRTPEDDDDRRERQFNRDRAMEDRADYEYDRTKDEKAEREFRRKRDAQDDYHDEMILRAIERNQR